MFKSFHNVKHDTAVCAKKLVRLFNSLDYNGNEKLVLETGKGERMGPQRLLLLGGLIYVAWRLFRSLIQEKITKELRRQDSGKKEPEVEDVLEEDVICGRLVPMKQAIRLRHDGKTYYFCSETCCDIFISEQKGSAG